MKKTLVSLFVLIAISAFIFKVTSKPVSGAELNIRSAANEIAYSGKTDKRGYFSIKIPEKGNYSLQISKEEIKRVLNSLKGNKTKAAFVVGIDIEAKSESWTIDTEKYHVTTTKAKKEDHIEIIRSVWVENENSSDWSESLIDVVCKGNGEIKGRITYSKN